MKTPKVRGGVNMKARPDRYFEFLSDMVEEQNHQLLLKKLHSIEFYSILKNDDNR